MRAQQASILLIEDTPGIAHVLQALLEGEGYRVTWVVTVRDAIASLLDSPVDLILTDAFSRTGETALESVAAVLSAAAGTPVALLTAHRVAQEEAHAQGFCAVIHKPFELDPLLDVVRACLAASEVQPER
jgi:DNA-binding NtrC family response regulator